MPNRHRQLSYGNPLPQDWMDTIQDFLGTLLVNFRLQIASSGVALQVPAGVGNDLVGAAIDGKWRYATVTVQAAHPGGAAGTYDVWLTASDNAFVSGGPSGEIDNTNYAFAMQITPVGSTPVTTLHRRIAQVLWDGAKITRIIPLSGNLPLAISDVVVLAPETSTRNTIRPTGDFPGLRLQRHLDADQGDVWQVVAEDGTTVLARWSHDALIVPGQLSTTARNALPAGRRPTGGIFWNPTTGRHETNIGSDATPVWSGVGGYGPGISMDFMGPEATIPPRTCLEDGRYLDKLVEPGLWNALTVNGTQANPWDTFGGLPSPPAGMYRVPDVRGRGTIGKKDMGSGNGTTPALTGAAVTRTVAATLGALIGEEFHALQTTEIPNLSGTTGVESTTHVHTGTTAGDSPDHGHVYTDPSHIHGGPGSGLLAGNVNGGQGWSFTGGPHDWRNTLAASTGISIGGATVRHTHTFSSSGQSVNHTHTFSTGTAGSAHENVFPVAVVNKVITL